MARPGVVRHGLVVRIVTSPVRCVALGVGSTGAITFVGVALRLPPDPTGVLACLMLAAILVLHQQAQGADWDLDFARLLEDRLPPPPGS